MEVPHGCDLWESLCNKANETVILCAQWVIGTFQYHCCFIEAQGNPTMKVKYKHNADYDGKS